MLKVLWFRFQQYLGQFTMLLFEGSTKMGLFRFLSDQSFLSLEFPKCMSYEGHLFLENGQNLIYMLKKQKKKMRKSFSVYRWLHLNWLR